MSAEVKNLASDGATSIVQQTWGPFVSGLTEVFSTKIKFGVENVGSRALGGTPFSLLLLEILESGTNDGFEFYFTAPDTATLSKPWGIGASGAPIVSVGGSGGVWSGTGTFGYTVTATNATGETIGSVEAQAVITATTQKATLTWVQTPGATGYNVYRTATPGTYGASTLRATIVGGSTVTFVDDGSATTTGTPPAVNTTAGTGPVYGTPPADGSFDQTNKIIATGPGGLAIGQQWFYWAQVRVPAATSELDNRRTLNVTPIES